MPSKAALTIIKRMEEYLGRALTDEECLKCEELNLNWFVGPIIGYIEGLMRKGLPRDFDLVYIPFFNGVIKGAYRRRDVIRITGRFAEVYKRLHAFTGDGMTNSELECVIFLADDCSDRELDAAMAVARARGVHHINYVRAVIEGNRKAASRSKKAFEFKEFVPDEYGHREKVKVPRVDVIRHAWNERLKRAKEKIEIAKVELNAKKKSDR